MRKNIVLAFLTVLILLGTASCMPKVNPNINTKPINHPANWQEKTSFINNNDPVIAWWQQFNDPQLNGYINDVAKFNFDLKTAIARIKEERALRSGAQSNLSPQINTKAEYAKYQFFDSRTSSPVLPLNNNNPSLNFFDAGFDASWEIDVWGKQRWNIIAATENVEEANEYKRAVLISLISELARNYMELRGSQNELSILQKNIENQNSNFKLIQSSHKIGLSPKIDAVKAQELLAAMQSQVPDLQASIKASAYNISVLTGRNPETLLHELLPEKPLPHDINVVAVGLPANLILRRPDIRQAQRTLGAAIASAGSAKADLYPSIEINGGVGFSKVQLGDLMNITGGLWSIAPTVNWKIFDRRSLEARFNANKANAEAADAALRQTVLTAIKDVETSISALDAARKTKNDLRKTFLASEEEYAMTKKAHQIGLKTQIDIIAAKKTYLDNQLQLMASKTKINLCIINLYKSLGGGWQYY